MIEFYAPGTPSTKGSARAFVRGGRAVITNDAGERAKAWAAVVALAAREAWTGPPLAGPVAVAVTFYLQRPRSHYRRDGSTKPGAPIAHAQRPDLDKLLRCTLDAMTGIAFGDDSQIARISARKRWADEGTGASVRVWTDE